VWLKIDQPFKIGRFFVLISAFFLLFFKIIFSGRWVRIKKYLLRYEVDFLDLYIIVRIGGPSTIKLWVLFIFFGSYWVVQSFSAA